MIGYHIGRLRDKKKKKSEINFKKGYFTQVSNMFNPSYAGTVIYTPADQFTTKHIIQQTLLKTRLDTVLDTILQSIRYILAGGKGVSCMAE